MITKCAAYPLTKEERIHRVYNKYISNEYTVYKDHVEFIANEYFPTNTWSLKRVHRVHKKRVEFKIYAYFRTNA